jgi:hypothetical protein
MSKIIIECPDAMADPLRLLLYWQFVERKIKIEVEGDIIRIVPNE